MYSVKIIYIYVSNMLGQLLALKKDLELTKVIQTLLKLGVVWQSIFLMFVALVLVNLSFARTVIRKSFCTK